MKRKSTNFATNNNVGVNECEYHVGQNILEIVRSSNGENDGLVLPVDEDKELWKVDFVVILDTGDL